MKTWWFIYRPVKKGTASILWSGDFFDIKWWKHIKNCINSRQPTTKFTSQPTISYRSARKLSSYLVRAKLHPIEREVGSCKCNVKRCEAYKNLLETDRFACGNDQTTYKINHKFDCNEKCLVDLITRNKRLKQYVGQTLDKFRSRWNNYKDNSWKFDRGEDCIQRTFTNIFTYQIILVFCKIPMLLSLIRLILGHPLSVKTTGYIPLR